MGAGTINLNGVTQLTGDTKFISRATLNAGSFSTTQWLAGGITHTATEGGTFNNAGVFQDRIDASWIWGNVQTPVFNNTTTGRGVPGATVTLKTNNVSIDTANFSVIDLSNKRMIVDYTGASPLNNIRSWIILGRSGGTWTGPGIKSSNAGGGGGRGVGYGEAASVFGGAVGSFGGYAVDNTTILLTYTLLGDADLNRSVNLDDFTRLAAGFGQPGNWTRGDFTYDGLVNLDDCTARAANFGQTLPADLPRSAVPEPTLIVPAALVLLLPRRRRTPRGLKPIESTRSLEGAKKTRRN